MQIPMLKIIVNNFFLIYTTYEIRGGMGNMSASRWRRRRRWAKCLVSFYRTAAKHPRSCHEHRSVRPSVRLSLCQTRELWQNERNLCPNFYTIWKIDASSFDTNNGWWEMSPSTWRFGSKWATPFKNGDFQSTVWVKKLTLYIRS